MREHPHIRRAIEILEKEVLLKKERCVQLEKLIEDLIKLRDELENDGVPHA